MKRTIKLEDIKQQVDSNLADLESRTLNLTGQRLRKEYSAKLEEKFRQVRIQVWAAFLQAAKETGTDIIELREIKMDDKTLNAAVKKLHSLK